MKIKLGMKYKACGYWNKIEVNKLFIEKERARQADPHETRARQSCDTSETVSQHLPS